MRVTNVLIAAIIVMAGCAEEASKPELPATTTLNQFPLAPGNQWTYVLSDSVHGIAEPPFRNVWTYTGGKYTDTTYVAINGDTVFIYDTPTSPEPATVLVFPLQEGASWGNSLDTSSVYLESRLQLSPGEFAVALRVDRTVEQFNYTLRTRTWIVADIGIVMLTKEETDLVPVSDETWRLIKHAARQ